ncbi:MAG: thioredoxin family protein [Halobacteriaceae archaeon]
MSILSEDDAAEVAELFERLDGDVGIHLFVDDCGTCEDAVTLNRELVDLSERLSLSVHDLDDPEAATYDAAKYDAGPVAVFTDGDGTDTGVRYFGVPSGQEFNSYLTDVVAASTGETQLDDAVRERLVAIDEPVEITVFVTPTCPHCPRAVITAHSFALENEHVTAEMVEAQEFMELSQEYGVRGVPQVNVNGHAGQFTGARPPSQFLDEVEAAL